MSKKISVIVPIFNIDNYLGRCVESIATQTYSNLEIVLVDDGSLDNCPILCDAWARKDKRVRVIHKKNGGLSDARNTGIETSSGDYLLFVDGDDYIEPTMCEKLMTAVECAQADIAVCDFYWEYSTHRDRQSLSRRYGEVVLREQILEDYFLHGNCEMVVAWNKLYRRELFFSKENIRYPLGKLHEDEFTTYRLLYTAKKIVFVDEPLYYYVQRRGSIMSNYNKRNLQDYVAAVKEYCSWADMYAPDERKLMEYATFRNILNINLLVVNNSPLGDSGEITEELKRYSNDEIKDYLHNPYANIKDKIKYFFYKCGLYIRFFQIWQLIKEM